MRGLEPGVYQHGEPWTEARVERLRKMFAEGLTASEIAERLGGVTRNSVIGKIGRLGLAPESWTAERSERLTALWKDGKSASEIAADLGGVSRNAVLAKADRLGLLKSRGSASPPPARRPSATAPRPPQAPQVARNPNQNAGLAFQTRKFTATPPAAPDAPITSKDAWDPLPGIAPVTIMGLKHTTCRWPIDLPGETQMHYCGALAIGGVYCLAHATLSRPRAGTKERVDERLGVAKIGRAA